MNDIETLRELSRNDGGIHGRSGLKRIGAILLLCDSMREANNADPRAHEVMSLAKMAGVSRASFRRWRDAFFDAPEGTRVDALLNLRNPGRRQQVDSRTKDRVVEMRTRFGNRTAYSTRAAAMKMAEEGAPVSPSSINRIRREARIRLFRRDETNVGSRTSRRRGTNPSQSGQRDRLHLIREAIRRISDRSFHKNSRFPDFYPRLFKTLLFLEEFEEKRYGDDYHIIHRAVRAGISRGAALNLICLYSKNNYIMDVIDAFFASEKRRSSRPSQPDLELQQDKKAPFLREPGKSYRFLFLDEIDVWGLSLEDYIRQDSDPRRRSGKVASASMKKIRIPFAVGIRTGGKADVFLHGDIARQIGRGHVPGVPALLKNLQARGLRTVALVVSPPLLPDSRRADSSFVRKDFVNDRGRTENRPVIREALDPGPMRRAIEASGIRARWHCAGEPFDSRWIYCVPPGFRARFHKLLNRAQNPSKRSIRKLKTDVESFFQAVSKADAPAWLIRRADERSSPMEEPGRARAYRIALKMLERGFLERLEAAHALCQMFSSPQEKRLRQFVRDMKPVQLMRWRIPGYENHVLIAESLAEASRVLVDTMRRFQGRKFSRLAQKKKGVREEFNDHLARSRTTVRRRPSS